MDTLDAIDLKILTALQAQGDLTNLKLAELVGLSPSPCLQRVRRLRKAGYVRGVTVIVNTAKLFPSVIVYTKITLAEQTVRRFTMFENAIQKIPEVLECSLMSGEFNYFLKVISRDLEHFNALIQSMMEMDIGIKTFSMFVEIRSVKRTSVVPLELLMRKQSG
jgi:DNA-binding Lrp family transcriptional regulator